MKKPDIVLEIKKPISKWTDEDIARYKRVIQAVQKAVKA